MKQTIEQYLKVVDTIFGIYLDSTAGFAQFSKMLMTAQVEICKKVNVDINDLKDKPFYHSKGDMCDKSSYILHSATQKEVLERNKENGLNYKTIGNLCMVLIYQYWEEHYRELIAKEYGFSKNDLKIDIFGDLRNLRNSIIHHKGIEIDGKYKILKWFKKDKEIKIDKEQFEEIILNIRNALVRIQESPNETHHNK